MSSNEVWAKRQQCGTELKQSDEQCPVCGSTKKVYKREALTSIGLVCSTKNVHKRKGIKRPLREMIFNRWKRSGDQRLQNGVREDMVIDRERNQYYHTTRDAKTGEVTHTECGKLSDHKKGG